ncbi:hypothetical protein OCK74_27460 [Chitinophagaceae bacterium LB-8]|uniref:VCBS repeat-containing protein n=1 Tax=Paraflavisolibacter caeni TaxID=2982496 RepID=A0A9X2Y2Q5_9BACT|nr:hypothetical protein [Paraflavisolibacter caeni]MCU7552888.1 hypothetical protein [Paraflavisolibacter caeni]
MYRTFFTPILLILSILSFAQTNPAEGAKLLFTNVKSSLSIADKNLIYKNLGVKLSKDKTQFVSMEDEGSEFPFTAQVFPSDLNKDGKEDIFVVYGNSYTSGQTGSSVVLYI